MDIKEVLGKVNGVFAWLPFVKLAGKIPSGIIGKIPVLNTVIPFANHAAVVLLIVVLAACFGGGGSGGGNSGGSRSSGTASVVPASDFKYELSADSKGVTLLEYTGPGGNIILPTEIEGLPIVGVRGGYYPSNIEFSNVTSAVIPDYYLPWFQEGINPFRFDNMLESVTFPKGIKYIPGGFFEGCKGLKSYTIPDTVTEIRESAFTGSGLTSIVIPEGVTIIYRFAFVNCVDLKSVTLPESIKGIGDSAFSACANLETVNLPSHQIDIVDDTGSSFGAFNACPKLSLSSQQAIRNAGYTGTFN